MSPLAPLLPVDEARRRLLAGLPQGLGTEELGLGRAAGRVAAGTVCTPRDLPPFANSAVDGYALAGGDLDAGEVKALRQIGRAAAGHPYGGPPPGFDEAVRILTGAPIPAGCDRVVMQEQVQAEGDALRIAGPLRAGDNLRPAGGDLAAGAVLLSPGQILSPPRLALLAAAGLTQLRAWRPVRLAFFATGDELRAPGEPLAAGQIHESNRQLLQALAAAPWLEPVDLGIVPDQPQLLEAALLEGSRRADILLSSGGVSVGDTDFMPGLVRRLGSLDFWKVAVKPGKPLAVGRIGDRPYFGLPGNPVSAAVTFLLFVLPALRRLAGMHAVQPSFWRARLAEAVTQHAGRETYLRARRVSGPEDEPWPTVQVLEGQGSHQLSALAEADCLLRLPADCEYLAAGATVEVLLLPWSDSR